MNEKNKPSEIAPDPETDITGYVRHHRERFNEINYTIGCYDFSTGSPGGEIFYPAMSAARSELNRKSIMPQYHGSRGVYRTDEYAEYMRQLGVSEELEYTNFLSVNGGTHGYVLGTETLLDKNDVLVIPVPTYGYFAEPKLLGHTNVAQIHLREEDGYKLTPEILDRELTRINREYAEKGSTLKASAFLNINPHNPTGAVYTREELVPLAAVMNKHGIKLVIDDLAYVGTEYAHDKDYNKPRFAGAMASVPGMFDKTYTILSLSKSFNATAMRSGLVVAPKKMIDKVIKVVGTRSEFLPAASQAAMIGAFKDDSAEERKKYLRTQAVAYGYRYHFMRLAINGWDNDGASRGYMQKLGIFDEKALAEDMFPSRQLLSTTENDAINKAFQNWYAKTYDMKHMNWGAVQAALNYDEDGKFGVDHINKKFVPEINVMRSAIRRYNREAREAVDQERQQLIQLLRSGIPGLRALPVSEAGFFLTVDASAVKDERVWDQEIGDGVDLARILAKRENLSVIPGEAMGEHGGKLIIRMSFTERAKDMLPGILALRDCMGKVNAMPDDSLKVFEAMKRGGPEAMSATEKLLAGRFGAGKERT